MARRSLLCQLRDATVDTLRDPIGAFDKGVEQAKGTLAVGRMLIGRVTRVALGKAAEVTEETTMRPERPGPEATSERLAEPAPVPAKPPMRTPAAPTPPAAAETLPTKAPAKKGPAKKAPATKAPATKAPATKAPATEAAAKKAAKRATAKQATAKKTAKKAPGARATTGDTPPVTPADIADQVARRPATKRTTAKQAPARKSAAKRSPAKRTAAQRTAPLTARQVADVEDAAEVTTPVGTTAADVATNPDTTDHDLQQPGTEPLLDPSTAKAVRSEQETLSRAADPDKG